MNTKKLSIPPSVKSAVDMIKDITGNTCELNIASLVISGVEVSILSAEGIAGALVQNEMLSAAAADAGKLDIKSGDELIDALFSRLLVTADKELVTLIDDALIRLFSGFTVIIADGSSHADVCHKERFAADNRPDSLRPSGGLYRKYKGERISYPQAAKDPSAQV